MRVSSATKLRATCSRRKRTSAAARCGASSRRSRRIAVPAVDAIREALKPLALEAGNNEARGGSDLGPLRALGVPILDLSQDATNYFDVHHTMNDTLAKVDAKTLNQVVAAYAVAAYMAASKNGDFGRGRGEKRRRLSGRAHDAQRVDRADPRAHRALRHPLK